MDSIPHASSIYMQTMLRYSTNKDYAGLYEVSLVHIPLSNTTEICTSKYQKLTKHNNKHAQTFFRRNKMAAYNLFKNNSRLVSDNLELKKNGSRLNKWVNLIS